MKRYFLYEEGGCEDQEGPWVRYSDVAELVSALKYTRCYFWGTLHPMNQHPAIIIDEALSKLEW